MLLLWQSVFYGSVRYWNIQSPHTSSSNLTTFAWALLSAWSLISMCLLWSSVVDRSVFNSISSFSFSRRVSLSEFTQFPPQKKKAHAHYCLKVQLCHNCTQADRNFGSCGHVSAGSGWGPHSVQAAGRWFYGCPLCHHTLLQQAAYWLSPCAL